MGSKFVMIKAANSWAIAGVKTSTQTHYLYFIRFAYYIVRMIKGFKCKKTQAMFEGLKIAKFKNFEKVALRKLDMLDAAVVLRDLASPPGNKLEALKKDRKGQHSIRINDQFRICFNWTKNGPTNVEITDYH